MLWEKISTAIEFLTENVELKNKEIFIFRNLWKMLFVVFGIFFVYVNLKKLEFDIYLGKKNEFMKGDGV